MAQPERAFALPAFAATLHEIARHLGVKDFVPLHWMLIEQGVKRRERNVERWWTGTSEPRERERSVVLNALQKGVPDLDVWAIYTHNLRSFKKAPRRSRGHLSAVPDGASLVTEKQE